jgi:hypothetical protein
MILWEQQQFFSRLVNDDLGNSDGLKRRLSLQLEFV